MPLPPRCISSESIARSLPEGIGFDGPRAARSQVVSRKVSGWLVVYGLRDGG